MTTRCIGRTKKFLSGLTTHQPLTPFLWSDAGSANIVARTKLYPEIGDTAVIEILTQHYVKTQIISAHAEKGRTVLAALEALRDGAVPVIRCGECMMHGNCTTEDVFNCSGMDMDEAFCCAGKRKDGDGNG